MFQKFIAWVRSALMSIITNIGTVKQQQIQPAISNEMQVAINAWHEMFMGRAEWLNDNCQSMGLPESIVGELARLSTVEMVASIAGSARADYLAQEFKPILDNLRSQTEYACADGGMVFKPYIDEKGIAVDFVKAENFIPTAFNGRGEITGAAFIEQVQRGNQYFTRIEHHNNTAAGYTVTNRAFMSWNAETIGTPYSLSSVDEWASLETDVTIVHKDGTRMDGMLFSYFKMPFGNNVDPRSPLGVSAYSRAVKLIEQADKQYSRILWEYEASELAIDASVGAIGTSKNGTAVLPTRKKRLFRELNLDMGNDGDLYKVFSPTIRDQSLFNGLQNLLRRIEFACYLSYGTISDPNTVEKTAEEIKSSKQRSFSAVSDIQKNLEAALRELLTAMDTYASLYNLCPAGKYALTINWGDSISTDTDKERAQMRQDCRDGAAQWWEYRMKFYGETEDEAKAATGAVDDGGTDPFGFNAANGKPALNGKE